MTILDNLNDCTSEGLRYPKLRAFSVQHHPEAAPGPHEAAHLFDEFIVLMDEGRMVRSEKGASPVILIIDFGSQYNQLIARRVREHQVYCQIEPPDIGLDKIKVLKPEGIILSGGPASIYEAQSPRVDKGIFGLGIPILGICYGLQFMVDALGGKVAGAANGNTVSRNWPSRRRESSLPAWGKGRAAG